MPAPVTHLAPRRPSRVRLVALLGVAGALAVAVAVDRWPRPRQRSAEEALIDEFGAAAKRWRANMEPQPDADRRATELLTQVAAATTATERDRPWRDLLWIVAQDRGQPHLAAEVRRAIADRAIATVPVADGDERAIALMMLRQLALAEPRPDCDWPALFTPLRRIVEGGDLRDDALGQALDTLAALGEAAAPCSPWLAELALENPVRLRERILPVLADVGIAAADLDALSRRADHDFGCRLWLLRLAARRPVHEGACVRILTHAMNTNDAALRAAAAMFVLDFPVAVLAKVAEVPAAAHGDDTAVFGRALLSARLGRGTHAARDESSEERLLAVWTRAIADDTSAPGDALDEMLAEEMGCYSWQDFALVRAAVAACERLDRHAEAVRLRARLACSIVRFEGVALFIGMP